MSQWAFTDAVRSWNFPGYEGKPVTVEVYADADEVELLVNGRSAGRRAVGDGRQAFTVFEAVYAAGKVEAVAYRGGREAGRDEIATAGDRVLLTLAVSSARESLPADGSDIAYVDACLTDEQGRPNPGAVRLVEVSVEGPGKVIGFGSADPASEEDYFVSKAHTFRGRIRAAVRASGAGKITVRLRAEDCEASCEIEAE